MPRALVTRRLPRPTCASAARNNQSMAGLDTSSPQAESRPRDPDVNLLASARAQVLPSAHLEQRSTITAMRSSVRHRHRPCGKCTAMTRKDVARDEKDKVVHVGSARIADE